MSSSMDSSQCDECIANKDQSDRFSEPMVWIGIYIAIASGLCILAMAADLLHRFRSKKIWYSCKYFSLNTASIMVITVAMKLPVDLSSPMPGYTDQAAKVGSLAFMCTLMANLMPSLASMDDKTLLANILGLCILVITIIVNICIQISTGVIGFYHPYDEVNSPYLGVGITIVALINMAMIFFLLIIMISLSITIPTSKEVLESKYRTTTKKISTDPHPQYVHMSRVEKLRQHVRRYWVIAETGSPQFGMATNPLSTASSVICVMVLFINLFTVFSTLFQPRRLSELLFSGGSPYKWSTTVILITQSTGVMVGNIAPIGRLFSFYGFKWDSKWNRKYFMFFKVENYWIQKLHEWKQSPVPFPSSNPRLRSFIYNSRNHFLSFFIGFQKVIVILCKLIWLIVTVLPASWATSPITSRIDDIYKDLSKYALQIDDEKELDEHSLKGISKSMNSFISKAEKEQNNNLLELLNKFTEFEGLQLFDTDYVQSLLPAEFVNSWSLPIVTLTCVAVSIPNVRKDVVESLLRSVGEGLSFTHLVEESLNCSSEHVNIRKASMSLWHEVDYKRKWLDNPLANNAFNGKGATEIVKWFSDTAKEIVTKIKESTNGELAENPPNNLIAANSMYRITQTILLRFQSNTEPVTKKQLFSHLNGMIADIFCACFTNLPRVITMRCHESVIEKREASVRVAAKLLGKTAKIIEKLEKCDKVPRMDDEKLAYIDEWRLYMKQSIP